MLTKKHLATLTLLSALILQAQIGGGSIVGVAKDPSGAPVVGVKILAHNQETNEERAVTTNAEGYYEFPLLPTGHYRLEAEATGFDKLRGEIFELSAGTRPRIDLELKVGSVNQTIDVAATAPLVNTTTTDLGVVMTRERVDELPLNGRNFEDLVSLQAGVIDGAGNSAGARGGISFHGSASLGTNLLLDGVDMSFGEVNGTAGFKSAGGGSTLINTVSVEAVEQFKSTASASSAEFGRAGGGVLNVVTRSGSNTFHGTLFEFFRNDQLNANDFFSNKNGQVRPPLRWNQYGANLGGPIRRDRLFFFFNYEGDQVERFAKVTGNVPTAAFLAIMPAAARSLLSLLPTTYTPTSNIYIGLHSRNGQQVNSENTYLGRVDALLGAQRLAVRTSYNNQTYTSPNIEPTMPTVYPLRYLNAVVEHTYTLGPTAFNELRLGFNRVDLNRNPQGYQNVAAWITVQGINASQSNYIHFLPTTYTIADNFTRILGRHSLKTGLELREVRSVRDQGGPPTYAYTTTSDLINENPATVQLSFGGSKGQRTVNTGYYFQDDWHVSNNFQMNLGMRYEYSPPMRGGFNVAGSDPFGPFIQAQQPMFAADYNDFGPRLGMVYALDRSQHTVIRTGAAICYIMPQPIFYYDMAYINPALPGVATITSADVPKQYLTYPNIVAFQNQVQANPTLLPSSFKLSRSVADFNRRDTYVANWNFAVQRQLTSSLALQAAYVGQRTVKLISVRPLNLVGPDGTRQDPSLGQINFEENAANISYHALELSVNQRIWHGLSYDAYFTWSKSIGYYTPDDTITFTGNGLQDPLNIAGSTGPTEGMPNKYAKGVASYAIPGGGAFHNRFLRAALGGWTLRSIVGWRSGIPINVVSGSDFTGNGRSAGQRPDAVTGVDPYNYNISSLIWLNPAAFTVTPVKAQKRYGNLGFDALVGPRAFTLDSGLHKTFSISERQKLTFRLESFNTLNHPVFSNPTSTFNSANFTQITTTTGSPRAYQVALKYAF
jgi:hypothetical protein